MCGRYEFCFKRNIDDPVISEEQAASITQRSNNEVFPSDHVLAFIGRQGSIQALCMQWGFSLKKQRVINARLETLQERPLFRSFAHWRCVLPCNGYFEWMNTPEGRVRLRISCPEHKQMYLAAIYNDQNEACVLTMKAEGHLRKIHDRMPILLDQRGMHAYLRGEQGISTLNAHLQILRNDPAVEQVEVIV